MAKQSKGPFEVRGRAKGDPDERTLGTHNDLQSAIAHSRSEHESGHYSQVTVIDAATQLCLHHLPQEEAPTHDGLEEPADR